MDPIGFELVLLALQWANVIVATWKVIEQLTGK
jgi:hypothetical protein